MNNVMAMTALVASLLVSTAAIAAPANLADALQPTSGLILVKGGGGGGRGGGGFGGGGHMGGGGAVFTAASIGGTATTSASLKAWRLRLGAGPAPWRDPFLQRLPQTGRGEGDEALHFYLR